MALLQKQGALSLTRPAPAFHLLSAAFSIELHLLFALVRREAFEPLEVDPGEHGFDHLDLLRLIEPRRRV